MLSWWLTTGSGLRNYVDGALGHDTSAPGLSSTGWVCGSSVAATKAGTELLSLTIARELWNYKLSCHGLNLPSSNAVGMPACARADDTKYGYCQ